MNCEEVRELLPAYVLGALDMDELEAVEDHLRTGHEHDDELVELRATVFALDRLSEQEALGALAAAPKRPLKLPRPGSNRLILGIPLWRMAIAAVVLVAVFAMGWFVAGTTGSDGGHQVSLLLQGPSGELLELSGHSSEEYVDVTMAGLERLPSDRAYQLWAIRDGEWMRIGLCNTNAQGGWKGQFQFQVQAGDGLALTVEPASGSATPTSAPLLISNS